MRRRRQAQRIRKAKSLLVDVPIPENHFIEMEYMMEERFYAYIRQIAKANGAYVRIIGNYNCYVGYYCRPNRLDIYLDKSKYFDPCDLLKNIQTVIAIFCHELGHYIIQKAYPKEDLLWRDTYFRLFETETEAARLAFHIYRKYFWYDKSLRIHNKDRKLGW